jgi:hypothetical protein
MTTAYTAKLQLALPVTGELDGTWGSTVNDSVTSMVEEAIAGLATISTWTGASHTLTTADGATSEARCMMLLLSGAPGAAGTVITPATNKVYLVTNLVTGGYAVTVKVSGQTGVSVPNGATLWLYCNGTDIVTGVNYAPSLTLGAALTVASGGTGATTLTGLVKGNGTSAFSAATANTDYLTPPSGTAILKANSGGALAGATAGVDYVAPTSGTAIQKANGSGGLTAATAGTDYVAATTGSAIQKANGSGGLTAATAGTDYIVPPSGTALLKANSGGALANAAAGTDYLAPPSGAAILKANSGGALANATAGTDYLAPPSGTALLKANAGGALANATANTDYLAPAVGNNAISGIKTATFNSQTTIATTSGSITVDWTTAQNQKQTEPTGTITYTFTAPPGPCHLQLLVDSDGTSTAQTFNWPGTVIWLGTTWAGNNNKKAIINFWYDGTNYYAQGANQV